MTISGESTKQLDILCRITGFMSDFLSFIVVELIRFSHGALQLLRAELQVNQHQEEFKCYTNWQRMAAMLHSNEQQRTQKDGDTEEECHNLAVSVQQRLLKY